MELISTVYIFEYFHLFEQKITKFKYSSLRSIKLQGSRLKNFQNRLFFQHINILNMKLIHFHNKTLFRINSIKIIDLNQNNL